MTGNPMRSNGPRSAAVGLLAALALVAICTLALYPLVHVTSVSSLGVVYLVGVVIVSAYWGLWLGIATSLLSALAFNFFHIPPIGRFTIADSRNWVALVTFFLAALATSSVSERARQRALEAERRGAEADLATEMARLLLARAGTGDALAMIGRRVMEAFELPWATVVLDRHDSSPRHLELELRDGERTLGALIVPREIPGHTLEALRRHVVPTLAAMLAMALERERLVTEAVETEGLRRSEAVKTAVLRAVSHDLRTPVTAMIAAGSAVRAPDVSASERDELGRLVEDEGARLSRLIDDLLALSKLEAHSAAPRLAECSVEEVIDAALAAQPAGAAFDVRIDRDLPPVQADFVQVERALSNLVENAQRYSGEEPVVLRARSDGDRVIIRVIDHGPGIAAADQDRIFEPFYRAPGTVRDAHPGSGLGLAIARGFIEAGGGRIRVESQLGRGSTFVVELPTVEAAS